MAKHQSTRRVGLVIAAVVALTLLVSWRAGWWPFTAPAARPAGAAHADSGRISMGLATYPVGNRPLAPALAGQTLDGNRLSLSGQRGHVVVLNVWASWCSPCRAEAPILARTARQTRTDGVRFVGVDTRDSTGSARAFARRFRIPYPSLIDKDGQMLAAFNGIVPIEAIPSTMVLDPSGRITARIVGKVTYSTLLGSIQDALTTATAKPTASPARQAR